MLLVFPADRGRGCRLRTAAAVAHATHAFAMALGQAPFAMAGMLTAELLTCR